MDRRLRFHLICLIALSALSQAFGAAAQGAVLQLSGDDFPELAVHQPVFDETGNPMAMACDQIRARRIDELDPLWKQAVERIHLDCEDLKEEDAGFNMAATVVTGFLRPGTVEFAGLPVAEIRLMDSDLWGDHQYLLQAPYDEVRAQLVSFIQSRCRAQQDRPGALMQQDCTPADTEAGLYLESSELGGIWVHAEEGNPARTVYAEAWSD
jgi:hypothetical protein